MNAEETFDLAAAGLRADGTDLRISVEVLASKLESSLPGRTPRRAPRRRPAWAAAPSACATCTSSSAAARYELTIDGDRVEGFREREVGGISIKRETLTPDQWVAALTAELRAEAQRSAEARAALEGLLR